jgi:excisionase family DNA binding protein
MELSKAFYSPHEVAQIADVHSSTILNYIASGRLYAVKLSERTYRIPARSVLQLLAPEQLAPPKVSVETDDAVNFAMDREIEEADRVTA